MPKTSAIYSSFEVFYYRFTAGILYAVYWRILSQQSAALTSLRRSSRPQAQFFIEINANLVFPQLLESSSPKSMVYFTTISGEEPRRKVRRKSSPPTTAVTSTPAATSSNTTPVIMTIPIPSSTTTPTALPIAPKTAQSRRTQPSRQPPPPTRARAVVAQRDSASRAGSAHIVNDDAPLAVPPIRIGSGQGFNSHNKESAAKEELALRKEALFIIDQAEKMRATSYERGKRSGVSRRGGKRNGKADDVGNAHDKESVGDGNGFERNHDYSDVDNWDSFEGPLERRPTLGSRLSSQTAKAPPALPPPRPFEVEFEEVQEYYRQKAEVSRTSRLRERPWNERHSPAIVIATNGKDVMPRDETEREYYQGLSGLTEEMEANASGFVHNVRVSLITWQRLGRNELTLNRQMSRR